MPTWNAQLQAGFVFVGLDPDPSRSVDQRFAAEMASNAGFTPPLGSLWRRAKLSVCATAFSG
jgi:hypothetical protein